MSESRTNKVVSVTPRDPAANIAEIKRMAEVHLLSDAELELRKILFAGMKNRNVLNVFRELRTKLLQKTQKENFVLCVTSVCEGAGNTYMASNLAAVFSLDQAKTALLIDCNLYQPGVETLFKLSADDGLTDYLVDSTIDVEDIIYASGVPRLRVIPVGSHCESGAEYFSSQKMQHFLAAVKQRYPDRFIFIDTPPIGTSAEARIISQLADYTVLIVPYGMVAAGQIAKSVDAIEPEKFAGLIFNN
jgi:capsular exopolysaccharide synthesis family protein